MYHAVSTDDLNRPLIERLIQMAETFRTTPRHILRARLQGTLVATLFYEPSTRTRLSFEAAVTRLGGNIVGAENARENSSAKKGESLADVFRVVGAYADAIVIRHQDEKEMALALPYSPVPIINAGAGSGEHPTQSLLDIYTLWKEFGEVDGLSVCMVGDLRFGRTVHSLLRVLSFFQGIQVTLVSPPELALDDSLLEEIKGRGLSVETKERLDDVIGEVDVIYQTRIQRERLPAEIHLSYATEDYRISAQTLERLPSRSRILHPLPRVNEIDPDVDTDERAAYFRQVQNGLFIRMALLDEILGGVLR
ncbi:aspartate carbamoyltransferase [Alicyclobacillus tolerans]|uniref:Aspartate carbamoyltransferase n=1 Tax=Alicyclobacillus tolerans TaxID=90970 RepID=A0ABT9LVX0_9BACL|nr:aspartate carbamoyltransferase [Alicyclobacillus tengchongensis]MDP9728415.1 aspartate carbamoyltransferase catalytic subunit [Alicyclobacillus tengchongensis]